MINVGCLAVGRAYFKARRRRRFPPAPSLATHRCCRERQMTRKIYIAAAAVIAAAVTGSARAQMSPTCLSYARDFADIIEANNPGGDHDAKLAKAYALQYALEMSG